MCRGVRARVSFFVTHGKVVALQALIGKTRTAKLFSPSGERAGEREATSSGSGSVVTPSLPRRRREEK